MGKSKIIPQIEPGSEITVHCRGDGCRETIRLTPSSKLAFPRKVEWTCGACAGLTTKWKMPEEKAERVKARAPGQKSLTDATVEEVDD